MTGITIEERGDGRIEVAKNGLVVYCGRSLDAARAAMRGLTQRTADADTARRYEANQSLPHAIRVMGRK